VVSPHVHLQFHVQLVGRPDGAGVAVAAGEAGDGAAAASAVGD
jgi:hypothetical protein